MLKTVNLAQCFQSYIFFSACAMRVEVVKNNVQWKSRLISESFALLLFWFLIMPLQGFNRKFANGVKEVFSRFGAYPMDSFRDISLAKVLQFLSKISYLAGLETCYFSLEHVVERYY